MRVVLNGGGGKAEFLADGSQDARKNRSVRAQHGGFPLMEQFH